MIETLNDWLLSSVSYLGYLITSPVWGIPTVLLLIVVAFSCIIGFMRLLRFFTAEVPMEIGHSRRKTTAVIRSKGKSCEDLIAQGCSSERADFALVPVRSRWAARH